MNLTSAIGAARRNTLPARALASSQRSHNSEHLDNSRSVCLQLIIASHRAEHTQARFCRTLGAGSARDLGRSSTPWARNATALACGCGRMRTDLRHAERRWCARSERSTPAPAASLHASPKSHCHAPKSHVPSAKSHGPRRVLGSRAPSSRRTRGARGGGQPSWRQRVWCRAGWRPLCAQRHC
eukprot:3373229-Rhodomonas_salina.2